MYLKIQYVNVYLNIVIEVNQHGDRNKQIFEKYDIVTRTVSKSVERPPPLLPVCQAGVVPVKAALKYVSEYRGEHLKCAFSDVK